MVRIIWDSQEPVGNAWAFSVRTKTLRSLLACGLSRPALCINLRRLHLFGPYTCIAEWAVEDMSKIFFGLPQNSLVRVFAIMTVTTHVLLYTQKRIIATTD